MHDVSRMRRRQGVRNLCGNGQRVIRGDRPFRNTVGKGRSLHEFERPRLTRLFPAVDDRDIGMVERGKNLRFTLESCESGWIGGDRRGQDLEGDLAVQLRVSGAKHHAHGPGAKLTGDLIGAYAIPDLDGHAFPRTRDLKPIWWTKSLCHGSDQRSSRPRPRASGAPPPRPTLEVGVHDTGELQNSVFLLYTTVRSRTDLASRSMRATRSGSPAKAPQGRVGVLPEDDASSLMLERTLAQGGWAASEWVFGSGGVQDRLSSLTEGDSPGDVLTR